MILRYKVDRQEVEVRVGLDEDWDAFTRSDDLFGLDVESTAFDDDGARFWSPDYRVRLVQFGTADRAYVLRPNVPAEREAIEAFLRTGHFVTWSAYDVLAVWTAFGVALGTRVVDGLLLALLLEPGVAVDHDLKSVSADLIDDGLVLAQTALHDEFARLLPKGSGIRRGTKQMITWGFSNVPLSSEPYLLYAGLDAIYARRLWPLLVEACGDFPGLVRMENWLAAQTTGATIRGMLLDVETTQANLDEISVEVAAARERIEERCGFAALSPKRVDWLAERGVEFDRLTKTGQPSLDKEALPGLLARYGDVPEVGDLLRDTYTLSTLSNLKTNLTNFLKAADASGRVHPNIKTLRAHTGRMSITAPAMQTLSKSDTRLRGAFLADPGYVLISADFANVELRVAAALSGEEKMIQAFRNGEDLHGVTTDLIYGPGAHDDPKKRAIGKKANFLTVYGGGAKALHTQGGLPLDQARDVISRFREAYPTLTRWGWDTAEIEGYVVTDSRRHIPVDPDRAYASSNYLIQSTARDLLVEAYFRYVEATGRVNDLWLMVHDEILLHVPEADAESAAHNLQAAMTTTYRGIPITSDVTVLGEKWAA